MPEGQVARVQFLSYGVVRNLGRLKALISEVVQRPPKRLCQALLLVSVWEWLQSDDALKPKVVHHAVECAKTLLGAPESAFVNAVLRQLPKAVAREPDARTSLPALARMNSHPEWLLHRYGLSYGRKATAKWTEWNQRVPKIYCHIWGNSPGCRRRSYRLIGPIFIKFREIYAMPQEISSGMEEPTFRIPPRGWAHPWSPVGG